MRRSASSRLKKNAISGFDLRKLSASSNTNTPTGDAALTVAVCGRLSSTDISPNTEPGLADQRHLGVAAQHLDAALGKDVEPSRGLALGQKHGPRAKVLTRDAGAIVEDRGHRGSVAPAETLEKRILAAGGGLELSAAKRDTEPGKANSAENDEQLDKAMALDETPDVLRLRARYARVLGIAVCDQGHWGCSAEGLL